MKIVFQNEHFVAVDKPPGMLSVPGRDPKDSRKILGRELETFLGCQIFPIHRLDAEVSGLVLYALTAQAHRAANIIFEKHLLEKSYQAFTMGLPLDGGDVREYGLGSKGTWKAKILRGKKRAYESPVGKLAITHYQVFAIHEGGAAFEWRLFPQTGRSHQLRWEMHRHGCPIWGDALYGSQKVWTEPEGIGLRAISLSFAESGLIEFGLPARLEVPSVSWKMVSPHV